MRARWSGSSLPRPPGGAEKARRRPDVCRQLIPPRAITDLGRLGDAGRASGISGEFHGRARVRPSCTLHPPPSSRVPASASSPHAKPTAGFAAALPRLLALDHTDEIPHAQHAVPRRRGSHQRCGAPRPQRGSSLFVSLSIGSPNKCDTIIAWISASTLKSELPPCNIEGWTSLMPGWCSPAAPSPFRTHAATTERTASSPPDTLPDGVWCWSGHLAARRVASYP